MLPSATMMLSPRHTLNTELSKTTEERQAIEARLKELHRQLDSIRNEIIQCERKRDALSYKEGWLRQKSLDQLPTLEEFIGPRSEPVIFDMAEAGSAALEATPRVGAKDHVHLDGAMETGGGAATETPSLPRCESQDKPEVALTRTDTEDWEDGLDGLGIAKCHKCGMRLPLDLELIDQHSKECCWVPAAVRARLGTVRPPSTERSMGPVAKPSLMRRISGIVTGSDKKSPRLLGNLAVSPGSPKTPAAKGASSPAAEQRWRSRSMSTPAIRAPPCAPPL